MTAVVLFGAGASYACANVMPRPPLGPELFDAVTHQNPELSLPPDLTETFRLNFESGMSKLFETAPYRLTPLQCRIAVYLLKLEPKGPTLYDQLLENLGIFARSIVWSSLNYDVLLDRAASAAFGPIDYVAGGHGPWIAKLHGSANFAAYHPGISIADNKILSVKAGYVAFEGPIQALTIDQAISLFSDPKEAFGPAMSLYMAGKQDWVRSPILDNVRSDWRVAVQHATSILIVGVAYNPADGHVWNPILQSRARIGLVDPNASHFLAEIKQTVGRSDIRIVAPEFSQAHIRSIIRFLRPGLR
ncbi:MAG: hypothetical protein ACTHN4_04010 [Sphingomicrobium sp.]